jgi:hypothetical protein
MLPSAEPVISAGEADAAAAFAFGSVAVGAVAEIEAASLVLGCGVLGREGERS